MRRAAKVDLNQDAIVQALRDAGATVQSLAAIGKGCPDLLVGWKGLNLLMECKRQREDRKKAPSLTADQMDWLAGWRGGVVVVLGPDDALHALGVIA